MIIIIYITTHKHTQTTNTAQHIQNSKNKTHTNIKHNVEKHKHTLNTTQTNEETTQHNQTT